VPKFFAAIATLMAALSVAAQSATATRGQGGPGARAIEGLSAGPRLAAVYDTILRAQFEEARAQLARTCPPAPGPACDALREVALWWEVQQNLSSRVLDARFEAAAATAIRTATEWTEREPDSGEAWFYLAGAYAPWSQWRVLRGERLAAARDGKRIKDALERALALDNRLQDAWFGIGLYHYYADVAPAALKFLRFLLLLPGGNRAQGMAEMLRTRERGELLRGEADFQLHWLYLWYENNPARALELLGGLDQRYPTNPLFLARIAQVQHEYSSDHRASAASWQTLLDRSGSLSPSLAGMTVARARVGLAHELIELAEPSRAIDLLDTVIRTSPTEPHGVLALAHLTRGDAYAQRGDRADAIAAYSRAVASAPRDDPDGLRTRARTALANARSSR
jgi:tetratricopeptide (TPR) repeat protein